MKKLLTATIAAVIAAGAIGSSAGSAQAEPYRYHRDRDNNNDAAAAAIVGGVLGLALGAAIAGSNSKNRGYSSNSYYGDGYYNNGYYRGGSSYYDNGYYGGRYAQPYAYAPRTCVNRERVYDPYIGRRVTIERRYAC
jgi:hypothetical protein